MPPKSNTELIQQLLTEVGQLKSQVAVLERESEYGSSPVTLQRLTALETLVAELVKSRDESARRATQFLLLVAGACFTVAVQLLIKFISK